MPLAYNGDKQYSTARPFLQRSNPTYLIDWDMSNLGCLFFFLISI